MLNGDTVRWSRVTEPRWHDELLRLVETHARETSSRYAELILHEWAKALPRFWHVVPTEYARFLQRQEQNRVALAG